MEKKNQNEKQQGKVREKEKDQENKRETFYDTNVSR